MGFSEWIYVATINHEAIFTSLPIHRPLQVSSLSNTLALMATPERSDATQVMYAPNHPAQALLTRFTCWEKRIENLLDFFTQMQAFQKTHSRHYTALSAQAAQTYGDDERLDEDGVVQIWKGLQQKTEVLARFYDGLSMSYEDKILRELRTKLGEIRILKGDLNRIRSKEVVKAEKKKWRFEEAVKDLTQTLNQIGSFKQRDDPYLANRSNSLITLESNCRMSFVSPKVGSA